MNNINKYKTLLVLLHIALGFLMTFDGVPKIYGVLIFVIALGFIIVKNNRNNEALLFSAYIVGSEVFLRMTKGGVFYEAGKYGVFLFVLLGFVLSNKVKKINLTYLTYVFLILLGIVATKVPEGVSIRKTIVFNLSGPILLGLVALYTFNQKINKDKLLDILYFMLLPIISMVVYLYFRTPDLKEIVFGGVANFEASGGFGPNQVATLLGVGAFIIIIFLIKKVKLSGFILLDLAILFYIVFRGLLTFSRGGMLTALLAAVIFIFFYSLYNLEKVKLLFKYLVISLVLGFSLWIYTSNATGGMLINRYSGKNAKGVEKEDVTSGRGKIFKYQFESLSESPIFGIGVGNGRFKRLYSGDNVAAASHNEIGRLIEEHGTIGIIVILILIITPFTIFININNYQRAFLIAFYAFWLLTINHSAMRIAFPSFIYGLCLININEE